ncbi:MAG TPA: glycosyltransferase family 2 protein [Patescibacteria group bacterium]|nr:glycosyltransferase family 2 protein [Patescibacteria group bacterium]
MEYVLLTPVRNEEVLLPNAIRSILSQNQYPALWLIVDDGSTDNTMQIIHELESSHSWIISKLLPGGLGELQKHFAEVVDGIHFAEVVDNGFRHLQSEATARGIKYGFIGKIDADVSFDPTCFSSLINEFEKDPSLGIASPRFIYCEQGEKGYHNLKEPDRSLSDHPDDPIRLYRRQCFDDIGGIQIVGACETVAEAKAKLRGWKIHRFDNIYGKHLRRAHSSTPLWSRLTQYGSVAYYLGYHPLLALGRLCFDIFFGRPRYRFLAYAWGYIRGYIKKEPRIDDDEILRYFWSQRFQEIVSQLILNPEVVLFPRREKSSS